MRCNSSHGTLSTDWSGRWGALPEGERTNPLKYDLLTTEGRFSPNALEAFLKHAQQHAGLAGWTNEQVREASQLDGVCAFKQPQKAFDYACLVPERAVCSLGIVELAGCCECVLPAEQDEGGVIVRVVSDIRFYRLEDFQRTFGLTVRSNILRFRPWLARLRENGPER